MLDFIKGENGKDYREKLEQAYSVMTKELNMPEFYEFIGITDPISIIKIDGQSVTDMYAEKYAGINDPEDKKLKAIYDELKATQDDPNVDVALKNDAEGSETYKGLMKAL
ncbi:MAG: hypothetical protein K6C35_06145 [Eubacterium sp.]|nr:hypothetical protein [Eubacterium sp.]